MRRRGLVTVLGVLAAGVLLATAGAGVAMQLDSDERQSLIRVGKVDPAAVDSAVKNARAKLKAKKLQRLLKAGNRPALMRFLKKNFGVDPKYVVVRKDEKEGSRGCQLPRQGLELRLWRDKSCSTRCTTATTTTASTTTAGVAPPAFGGHRSERIRCMIPTRRR